MPNPKLAAAAALAFPLAALAGGGWDWENEFQARHWRQATLQWAHDIHPDHPSFADLIEYFAPPAEELWCHDPGTPDPIDFQIHGDRLNTWLHGFLEIPPNEPLPENLPNWPAECFE